MNVDRPHPPYDEYRAAIGDRDGEHESLQALCVELDKDAPDPKVVDAHVSRLRKHPRIAGAVQSWLDHPRTQAFLAEISGAGL